MFGIMQHLKIAVCADADDAIRKGFDYKGRDIKPIEISQVVVVQKGTVEGNSTVDLLLHDEAGNSYVVMVTGNLLKSIPC